LACRAPFCRVELLCHYWQQTTDINHIEIFGWTVSVMGKAERSTRCLVKPPWVVTTMQLAKWGSLVVAVCAGLGLGLGAQAQDQGAKLPSPHHAASPEIREHSDAGNADANALRLPPDSVTHHKLTLIDRTLSFTAKAGTIKLMTEQGDALADVAYIAYLLDGGDPATRPVTFVFNGGPGAASAWLELGALGPWRLPLNGGETFPSSSPALTNNDDTWLDFTDLVFVDPPGTGYSRFVAPGEDVRKQLWSVQGDIQALAVVVRRWLAQNQRMLSPKFIVGESYGGFRAPRLAQVLAVDEQVGISGLVMISPLIDRAAFVSDEDPLHWAIYLPSYTAAMREKAGPVTRAQLADVEQYAAGDYVRDFLQGPRNAASVSRMVARVTALTGLDAALVQRLAGRIDNDTFLRATDRAHDRIVSSYDATIAAFDPHPHADQSSWLDPVIPGFEAPLGSAMVALYARELGWRTQNRYEILNRRVARQWDWGEDFTSLSDINYLKRMLALDARFRVLVVGGLTDLQIPYFGNFLLLNQIPIYGGRERIAFKVYSGGHMAYTNDASRKMIREDSRHLIEWR
jgi:carboxypeptidase C (cathepsin A)